jgi:hypothetical protein
LSIQHVPGVAQVRFLALSLARQRGLRIRRRLVGSVAALLPVKVDSGVAAIVIAPSLRVAIILGA